MLFLTEEKLDDIGAQMEMSPWKSWQFAVGCGVPVLSTGQQDFLRLYKIRAVQQLLLLNWTARSRCDRRFQEMIANGILDQNSCFSSIRHGSLKTTMWTTWVKNNCVPKIHIVCKIWKIILKEKLLIFNNKAARMSQTVQWLGYRPWSRVQFPTGAMPKLALLLTQPLWGGAGVKWLWHEVDYSLRLRMIEPYSPPTVYSSWNG